MCRRKVGVRTRTSLFSGIFLGRYSVQAEALTPHLTGARGESLDASASRTQSVRMGVRWIRKAYSRVFLQGLLTGVILLVALAPPAEAQGGQGRGRNRQLWHRLLRRSASQSATLCHVARAHRQGARRRRALVFALGPSLLNGSARGRRRTSGRVSFLLSQGGATAAPPPTPRG
jgi:hypothetical protein